MSTSKEAGATTLVSTGKETILVTGAAGTVGSLVASHLDAQGFRVVATDLNEREIAVPTRGRAVGGDLRDPRFVERVLDGITAIVHTAAVIDPTAPYETLAQVNVEVVRTLVAQAEAKGIKRLVHVSSSLLYKSERVPLSESSELTTRGAISRTKRDAEDIVRNSSLDWTMLRPAPVYGRRGRHFGAALLAVGPILRLTMPVLPRMAGGPKHSMVHADDLARALVFVLPKQETHREVYNVCDEDPMPLGDRVSATFRAYGLASLPSKELPRAWLDRVARVVAGDLAYPAFDAALLGAWKLVKLRHDLKPALRVKLDRDALSLLYEDLVLDGSKLAALGFQASHPRFEDSFRKVLNWYQAEGWVPRY